MGVRSFNDMQHRKYFYGVDKEGKVAVSVQAGWARSRRHQVEAEMHQRGQDLSDMFLRGQS